MKALIEIQSKLQAPKGQVNKFGNYNYRSCEDILAAVKPLLFEYKVHLTINDDIVLIGDRYYVKATACISDGKEIETVSAFARESFEKKGMDAAQITGAASSYARKYALNGLFAIDDTKDADATNKHEDVKQEPDKAITQVQAKKVKTLIAETDSDIEKLLAFFKIESVDAMTVPMFTKAVTMLSAKPKVTK